MKMWFGACSKSCARIEEKTEKRKEKSNGFRAYFPLSSGFTFFCSLLLEPYFASFESATAISPPKCALARNKIALIRTVSPFEISAIRASKNGVKSLP